MPCDYCKLTEAKYMITRLMQPSPVRPACKSCADEQHRINGVMIVEEL